MTGAPPGQLPRTAFDHAPYYCEENVWRLARHEAFAGRDACVLVITNRARACVFWDQRAAETPGSAVVWDYHVVLLDRSPPAGAWRVWDLDSVLPFPCPADEYLRRTFRDVDAIDPELAPRFRVVTAHRYVETFASDRRHMVRADGSWAAPPPAWEAIRTATEVHTLDRMLDVTDESAGVTLDLATARARFGA